MGRGKNKRQNKKNNAPKKKTNTCEPEVKVEYEKLEALDIVNSTDISIQKKISLIEKAEKNPEYAALIFTIISTVSYLALRIIAFLYHAGICVYNNVALKYINVNNDSTLFMTVLAILLMIIGGAIMAKVEQTTASHPRIVTVIIFITLTLMFSIGLLKTNPNNNPILLVFASICTSILFLVLAYIASFIQGSMLRIINKTVDAELKKLTFPTRLGVVVIIVFIVSMIMSFALGYSSVNDAKSFKTVNDVNDTYVVLYMNDEIAICSPYTENDNCIDINKSIQKNISLDDIEFETKVFDKVQR